MNACPVPITGVMPPQAGGFFPDPRQPIAPVPGLMTWMSENSHAAPE